MYILVYIYTYNTYTAILTYRCIYIYMSLSISILYSFCSGEQCFQCEYSFPFYSTLHGTCVVPNRNERESQRETERESEREKDRTYNKTTTIRKPKTTTRMYIYGWIYVYICIYVCMCVYVSHERPARDAFKLVLSGFRLPVDSWGLPTRLE